MKSHVASHASKVAAARNAVQEFDSDGDKVLENGCVRRSVGLYQTGLQVSDAEIWVVAQAARDPIERCVIAERHHSGEMLGRRCNLDNSRGNFAFLLPNADSLYTDWNDSLAGGVLWPSAPRLGGNVDVEWAAWRGWVNFTLSTAVRDGTAPQRPRWAWARGS
jgi:hypothetical protein